MEHKNYLDSLNLTGALWWFIENVAADAKDRNDYFFYLRERYWNEFQVFGATGGSGAKTPAVVELIEKAKRAESALSLASAYRNITQGRDGHRIEEALAGLRAALTGVNAWRAAEKQAADNEAASRALRISQGLPRFIVDGHEFPNVESSFAADGQCPPFVVFDIDRQENELGEYATRGEAERVADSKNNMDEGWDLWDVDGTGLLEIQRVDGANVFACDEEAVCHVRLKAALGSVHHQEAVAAHDKHVSALLAYRCQTAQAQLQSQVVLDS